MIQNTNELTVLRNLYENPLFKALVRADESDEDAAVFAYTAFGLGCETDVLGYIEEVILTDDNAFAVRCSKGQEISEQLKDGFMRDISVVFNAVKEAARICGFVQGNHIFPFGEDIGLTVKNLSGFYQKNGYGIFIRNAAFTYSDGKLAPIKNVAKVKLSSLKDYTAEKELIERNLTAFLQGLPALNMLLYGDKGTGKSSTVHAMLDKYFANGLRIIVLDPDSLVHANEIRQLVGNVPLKFILFVDDLSLSGDDNRISEIKANLEGSVPIEFDNSMVVVTSNRRHAVKESFSDRSDAVHAADALEEQLSLSDRFGLTVLFSSTGKAQYLSIVRQLAEDKKINCAADELETLAERWAILKGGRSPRHARQFVDLLYSCLSLGVNPDF